MDAAALLVALILAGQAGWTPERTSAPPPTSTTDYDRYAQPPSTGTSSVAPPPSIADRTRNAFTESGTALRDGFEAGAAAANEQFRDWADNASRQFQSTDENLRTAAQQSIRGNSSSPQAGNPFGPAAPQSTATSARTRGGVAPPPWNASSESSEPEWDADAGQTVAPFPQTTATGLQPLRTDSGWTSIGSHVAAPRLLVPALTTAPSTMPFADISSKSNTSGSTVPTSGRAAPPPANGADRWAAGWDNSAAAGQATISRSADAGTRSPTSDSDLPSIQSSSPRPPETQAKSSNNWADLWGEKDPWAESPQTPAAATTPSVQAPAITSTPTAANSAGEPFLAPPANGFSRSAATTPNVTQPPMGTTSTLGSTTSPSPAANTEPWIPLIVVSLSLAGSLGANLFLGWSYLDARQRYSTLVRKTADKFRRAATAAA